jgi:hypothetical protein
VVFLSIFHLLSLSPPVSHFSSETRFSLPQQQATLCLKRASSSLCLRRSEKRFSLPEKVLEALLFASEGLRSASLCLKRSEKRFSLPEKQLFA